MCRQCRQERRRKYAEPFIYTLLIITSPIVIITSPIVIPIYLLYTSLNKPQEDESIIIKDKKHKWSWGPGTPLQKTSK